MSAVRALRESAGLTQAELAERASTSQPTIAAYESGRKSPTLRTLKRLARAVGVDAYVQFYPVLTREDRRSIELHRAMARRLLDDPDAVLALARQNLRRMARNVAPGSQLMREWSVLLAHPVHELAQLLVDPAPWMRELRHVTPFGGVLTAAERASVYRAFAARERARR
jgi:transcriptional regulator with XRE-family HTH domain